MTNPCEAKPKLTAVSHDLLHEIEAFLFREARLLDGEGQREWLTDMVHKDIQYKVWAHQLKFRKDEKRDGPSEGMIYDDDYQTLDIRVSQFETGMQWRVDPPERLRHLVTNVEAYYGVSPQEFDVYSNCLVSRNRRVYEASLFVYGRVDKLRRDGEGRLQLFRREVDYDQRFVQGRNLLFFF